MYLFKAAFFEQSNGGFTELPTFRFLKLEFKKVFIVGFPTHKHTFQVCVYAPGQSTIKCWYTGHPYNLVTSISVAQG